MQTANVEVFGPKPSSYCDVCWCVLRGGGGRCQKGPVCGVLADVLQRNIKDFENKCWLHHADVNVHLTVNLNFIWTETFSP